MKEFLVIMAFALLAGHNLFLLKKTAQLDELLENQLLTINAINDSAEAREDKLQDVLEERIAKIENNVDSIQFILGIKNLD